MNAADGDGHPANVQRNGITPEKDAAMADRDRGPFIHTQRTQPLALIYGQAVPVDRGNFRALAGGKLVKKHDLVLRSAINIRFGAPANSCPIRSPPLLPAAANHRCKPRREPRDAGLAFWMAWRWLLR